MNDQPEAPARLTATGNKTGLGTDRQRTPFDGRSPLVATPIDCSQLGCSQARSQCGCGRRRPSTRSYRTSEMPRRFPPPWSVEEAEACLIMKDHAWQRLACVYFEDEPGRRSAAGLLTKDEARRIAANIAQAAGDGAKEIGGSPAAPSRSDRQIPAVLRLLRIHQYEGDAARLLTVVEPG